MAVRYRRDKINGVEVNSTNPAETTTETTAAENTPSTQSAEVIKTETTVDKTPTPQPTATQKPQNRLVESKGFYQDWFAKYGPNKPMSEAELAKEAKKRKREKIFAAIGDGISALSNLYFTTKGAPNVVQNPMSDKVKARWDAVEAERKGNEKAWYQGYLQSLQLDDARAAAKGKEKADERDYKLRRDQYERQLAKDKVDAAVKDLEMKRKLRLIDEAEHDARLAKVLADYAEKNGVQMGKAKIGGGSSSSGGNQGTNPIYAKDGKGGAKIVGYTKNWNAAVAESARNGVVVKRLSRTRKNITGTENETEKITQLLIDGQEVAVPTAEVVETTESNTTNKSNESNGAQDYVPGAINGVKRTKYVPQNKR